MTMTEDVADGFSEELLDAVYEEATKASALNSFVRVSKRFPHLGEADLRAALERVGKLHLAASALTREFAGKAPTVLRERVPGFPGTTYSRALRDAGFPS